MKLHEYIQVSSRRGHFNFCDPSQESVSTHIAVMNPDGSKKMHCNIRTDCEIDETWDIVAEIDTYLKRILYSTDQENVKNIREYINNNIDNLWIGGIQKERETLAKKRDDLNMRISKIDSQLSGQGWFENGAWVEL